MGCFSEFIIDSKYSDQSTASMFDKLDVSDDETISNLFNYRSMKNLEIINKIKEENDKVVPLLKKKLDELMKKRDEKPIMIGTGKFCGSPCYAYNKNILLKCPKCNGNVSLEIENAYEKRQKYDEYRGRNVEVEELVEKDICVRFNYNEKVDQIDYDFNACCKYFDKIDKEKTVHWSADICKTFYTGETKPEVEQVEKDMPIHYMVIDGERFDFPYGLHMKEFFKMNNATFFPFNKNLLHYYRTIADARRAGLQTIGEIFWIYFENTREDLGQSLGDYGYAWIHKVYYFQCTECKHKYHIIKTSPFMHRDKSKDAK